MFDKNETCVHLKPDRIELKFGLHLQVLRANTAVLVNM